MLSKFSIVPGKSWGSADEESKSRWDGQRFVLLQKQETPKPEIEILKITKRERHSELN
jgi:hypothetical protein